jgi:Tfp pilus assembly protein PilZ
LINEINILDQPNSLMSAGNSNWYDPKQASEVRPPGTVRLKGGAGIAAEGTCLKKIRTSIKAMVPAAAGDRAIGVALLRDFRVPLFRIHTYKLYSQGVTNGG